MTFDQRKLMVLAVWVATVLTAGVILTVDTPNLWLPIAGLAIIPAVFANWLWDPPDPTLAELMARGRASAAPPPVSRAARR